MKQQLITKHLLAAVVPESLRIAEKVAERMTGKKSKSKHKASVRYSAAIRNYRTAVTRYKRAETLLDKHHKLLTKIISKYKSIS
jgi:hypothetical protein